MDAFVSRKRPRLSQSGRTGQYDEIRQQPPPLETVASTDEDSTEMKLALLLSLFPNVEQNSLLDILVSCDGSVETASSIISTQKTAVSNSPFKKRAASSSFLGVQTSLSSHPLFSSMKQGSPASQRPSRPQKGKTLHLFSPEDIAAHTPCSIIHNFLPAEEANVLLAELLEESKTFTRYQFQLFERTVESPHTASLYVSSSEERQQQTSEYVYGGRHRKDVRALTPQMRTVSEKVQRAVNEEVQKRIRTCYPEGRKLKYQSSKEWVPNAAFVNCYDGPAESVGFHSDELTYIGPRAIIGSLSLGVEREFRVRRIVAQDDDDDSSEDEAAEGGNDKSPLHSQRKKKTSDARADAQGQISIHLPHNSLLVMHAEMQEEWKHSITPAQTISPHPVSGNRRINITYRWYRESLHPRHTPRCRCGVPTILRCVQRKRETRGRYMWMCYAGFMPGKQACSFFQWAEFDDDGEPIWARGG